MLRVGRGRDEIVYVRRCGLDDEVDSSLDPDSELALVEKMGGEGGAVLFHNGCSHYASKGGADPDGT